MTSAAPYRHQTYTDAVPRAEYHLLTPEDVPTPGEADFAPRMQTVGDALRRAGVASIWLAHGTFAGHDAFGLLGEAQRFFPSASDAMRKKLKALVDAVAGDTGNYTEHYAATMQQALARDGEPEISVRRFHWSSENHHLGRADGAVRLVDELTRQRRQPGQRVLLWGHSHAGNVFALVSHLLSGNREFINAFFQAARAYYHRPRWSGGDRPPWIDMERQLAGARSPLTETPLDFVTFGTPLRYGWSTARRGKLLHFVNHRVVEGTPEYRAPFPPRLDDVLSGADGDYIHQFGIAGTNMAPGIFAPRSLAADLRLGRLLQPGLRTRDLRRRLDCGMRVAEDGVTLLVKYGPGEGNVVAHLAGHAVYTRERWMLFHAKETARRFYA